MPFCTHCGHQNPDGSNFCARCGEALQKVSAQSPPARVEIIESDGDHSGEPDKVNAGAEVETQVALDSTQVIRSVSDDGIPQLTAEEEAAVRALPRGSALLILSPGTPRSERFLIASDTTAIGRHPASDIFLDDVTVSRKHVLLTRANGAITVEDQGSLNGTYVNRHVIEAPTAIANGDEVMIGKFRLTFFASEHGLG